MSGTTGKTSTYIKNQNITETTQVLTGFKKVRFLHQATAGNTLIQLGALVAPATAVNYSAPSAADLAKTNLQQWSSNFVLTSSISGKLMENISYIVNGAASIKLLYAARDGEIFEGVIDAQARTGLTLVDASPINVSGTLTAGSTDFNVGAYPVGLYSTSSHGAILVYVDKVLAYRNTGNNPPGAGIEGDYYEVHSGNGLGSVIRFNNADLTNDRHITVVSLAGQVERPNGSLMAVMETLQGQIDVMVPTLAALAEVAENTFQGTPNNIDLKAFGDSVFALQTTVASLSSLKRDKTDGMGLKIGHNHSAGGATAMGANDLHFVRVIAPQDGVITRMSAFKSAQGANIRSNMAIFSSVAGLPSVKLGQTNEHVTALGAVGSQDGGVVFYDLQSPVSIVKGQSYWLSYHQDTTANMENFFAAATTGLFIYKTIAYTAVQPLTVTTPFTTAGANPSLGGW